MAVVIQAKTQGIAAVSVTDFAVIAKPMFDLLPNLMELDKSTIHSLYIKQNTKFINYQM